jgi:hypothetical protein
MTWLDLTRDWSGAVSRLIERFPKADPDALKDVPTKTEDLARHLAERHDMSLIEADEELKDWMFVEGLARQAFDIRA